MSMIGPVQSRCYEDSPVGKRSLRWEGFFFSFTTANVDVSVRMWHIFMPRRYACDGL